MKRKSGKKYILTRYLDLQTFIPNLSSFRIARLMVDKYSRTQLIIQNMFRHTFFTGRTNTSYFSFFLNGIRIFKLGYANI
jgi:hypothetical protein